MEAVVSSSLGDRRLHLALMGAFAILALALALVGVYGLMAYHVSEHRREIGVRMALGAASRNALAGVLTDGFRLIILGISLGDAVAHGLTGAVEGLLFEVSPTDLTVFAVVPLLLTITGLLACCVPALRASRLDPVSALRCFFRSNGIVYGMSNLFTLLLVSAMALSNTLAEDGNVFSNTTAGVSVTKPAGWHFMTAQQNADNLGRTRLEDKEFQEMMQKYATAPLVVMTKYQEPYTSLNPSVKIIAKPLGTLDGSNPVAILQIVKAPLEKAFKDFAVVEGPKETELSGLKAAYMRMSYTLATTEGAVFPTSSEIWVVPRGSFFFIVGVGSNQKPDETETTELKSIIESIKIEH